MKRVIFFFATSVVMCACVSSTTGQDDSLNSNTNVQCQPPLTDNTFISSDYRLFDVRGKVSKVVVKTFKCDSSWNGHIEHEKWLDKEYNFDKNGDVCFKSDEKVKLIRNNKGQLVKMETYMEDFHIYIPNEYVYNDLGLLDTLKESGAESYGEKTFKYDNNSDLISSYKPSVGEGSYYDETCYYKIVERDSLGNWTKRHITSVLRNECDKDRINCQSSEKNYSIETRVITYSDDKPLEKYEK